MFRNQNGNSNVKVVFVGDANSGKSQLINSRVNKPYSEQYASNITAEFISYTHEIDKKGYDFEIWDTAGQERFRVGLARYLRNTFLVVITIPATPVEDFKKTITYWNNYISDNASPQPEKYLYVLTKVDQIPEEKKNETQAAFVKALKEANTDNKELFYALTSAKDDLNVDLLFKTIAQLKESSILIAKQKMRVAQLNSSPVAKAQQETPVIKEDSHITPYYLRLEKIWQEIDGTWFDKVRAVLQDYMEDTNILSFFWNWDVNVFHWRTKKQFTQDVYNATLTKKTEQEIYEELYNISRLNGSNPLGDFAMLFLVVQRYSPELVLAHQTNQTIKSASVLFNGKAV